MEENPTKAANIPFKWARNEAIKEMGCLGVLDFDLVEFLSDGLEKENCE